MFTFVIALLIPLAYGSGGDFALERRAVVTDVDSWSPEREAAAQEFHRAEGDAVLPFTAWHALPAEARAEIALQQSIDSVVDAEVASTAHLLEHPRARLTKGQKLEIGRLNRLIAPVLPPHHRADLDQMLRRNAYYTATPSQQRFDPLRSELTDLHAEVLGRLAQRVLDAKRAGDVPRLKLNILAAFRLLIRAHLVVGAAPVSEREHASAQSRVVTLTGAGIVVSGMVVSVPISGEAGLGVMLSGMGIGMATAVWGQFSKFPLPRPIFRTKTRRLQAEAQLYKFWQDVEPYVSHTPEWNKIMNGEGVGWPARWRSAEDLAGNFVRLLTEAWPGSTHSLCEELLNDHEARG